MSVDQTLAQLSNGLVYSAMAVYAIALMAYATDLSRRGKGAAAARTAAEDDATFAIAATTTTAATAGRPGGSTVTVDRPDVAVPGGPSRAAGIAVSLTWLGFALHAAGVVVRGASVHRAPWGNMYEFSVTGAAVVVAVYLATLVRRDVRYLGTFVVGPVLLTLGAAVTVWYTEAAQLVPALDSYWLVIHVSVAFVASGLFTLGFSTAVLQVVQGRREEARAAGRAPRRGRFMDAFPSALELERSTYRLHVVAFPLWTFTVIAGAIWAEAAWGRYWGWDPKEVWSFVIWTVYAAYLHARVTRGWDGRRAAYVVFAGFACLIFNFVGVNILFSGLHSYA